MAPCMWGVVVSALVMSFRGACGRTLALCVAKATESLELDGMFFGSVEGKSTEKCKQWLEKFGEKAKTP